MENQKKIDAKRSKLEDKKRELLNELKNNALQEVMTLERETILGLHITELLDRLKSGELDPLAVLQAYQVLIQVLNFMAHFISLSVGQKIEYILGQLRSEVKYY